MAVPRIMHNFLPITLLLLVWNFWTPQNHTSLPTEFTKYDLRTSMCVAEFFDYWSDVVKPSPCDSEGTVYDAIFFLGIWFQHAFCFWFTDNIIFEL